MASAEMSKWAVILLAALVALLGPAACGSAPGKSVEVAAALEPAQQALGPAGPTLGGLRQGDVLAWLSSNPAQPITGVAELDAYLVGVDGEPVADATVTFDTDMTNMSHGLYLVESQPVGDGHYTGRINFSMPGPWRVIAVVERPGHETQRIRFEFKVNYK